MCDDPGAPTLVTSEGGPTVTHPHLHPPAHLRTQRTRRVFLADLGKGAFALFAVPIVAACSSDETDDPTTNPGLTSTPTPEVTRGATMTPSASPTTVATTDATGTPATEAGTWHRVDLGGVSAYALVRDNEVAIVDTGNPGSTGDFEAMFESMGLRWEDVGHVILTHHHPDHQGSLPEVMALAADATAYCGAADLAAIDSPRPPVAVGTGDTVFGVEIIETPGHTPGHIAVLDRAASVLVAGDAMTGGNGGVGGPNERFTPDTATAIASVGILAGYEYETIYFGHGEPVLTGGAAAVAALATELG